jgi:hypothetical protein
MTALYLGAGFVLAILCAYASLATGRGALGGAFTLAAGALFMASAALLVLA